jgi:hypothetical protein
MYGVRLCSRRLLIINEEKIDHGDCYFAVPLTQRREAPRMRVIYQWKAQVIDSISNYWLTKKAIFLRCTIVLLSPAQILISFSVAII